MSTTIEKMPGFKVAVMPPILLHTALETAPSQADHKVVYIEIERFLRYGVEHLFFVTNDEETALMLKSEQLPGQRKEYQRQYKEGFMDGFIKGLSGILNG